MQKRVLLALLLPLLGYVIEVNAIEVQVQGLFKNTAVLTINGKQRMLKAGQRSPEGVLLVSANTKRAVIDINGQRQTVGLSRRITSQFAEADKAQLSIPKNRMNQYITNASINGRRISVLVDTGANFVAMSSRHAAQIGLDYQQGAPQRVVTASGQAKAFRIKLRSVSVGGIEVNNIQASVIEGDYPTQVLLGMTYLEHVKMREQDGTLYLEARY